MKGRIVVRSQCCWALEAGRVRDAKEAERTGVPLVPIHSWSCSSLKVSLTFPPDLLYMPDKGTVGRRSWRHKSTVRKEGTVGQRGRWDRTWGHDYRNRRLWNQLLLRAQKAGQLTWAPLTDGITSSGFPLSSTFLCCYNISQNKEENETAYYIWARFLSFGQTGWSSLNVWKFLVSTNYRSHDTAEQMCSREFMLIMKCSFTCASQWLLNFI